MVGMLYSTFLPFCLLLRSGLPSPSIPIACVSQPKALVSRERHRVAITIITHWGRIDGQLQRRKEAGRYSGTGRERYGWGIRRVQPTRCNVSQFLYFCKKLYMFQAVFPSIIRSSKLHIQRQVFVRPIPDAVCAVLSFWWWTEKPPETCRASYRNKEIVKLCILLVYSANILATLGPMNVKCMDAGRFMLQFATELCLSDRGGGNRPQLNSSRFYQNERALCDHCVLTPDMQQVFSHNILHHKLSFSRQRNEVFLTRISHTFSLHFASFGGRQAVTNCVSFCIHRVVASLICIGSFNWSL